ncbi:uncharacterized protein LOC103519375 [Diaphorina citri]|uniref:Uncharacterized protein LOC103519375 n=1 Tax=Diaphorina citri TaxID=121845 RepID=A0A1S3DIJ3_DIACI|nr:uncharacterized protein LOC103519375 [Diaphorina citri]
MCLGFHSNGGDASRNHSNAQDLGSHSNGRERDAFGSHSNGRDAFGSQSNQNASLGTECFHSNGSDGGYTSGHTSALSSPASSEVACSDGFCNHEGSEDCSTRNEPPTNLSPLNLFNSNLSLEQMLHGSWSGCPGDRDRGSCDDLEDDGECCIPLEEVEKFRARIQNVEEKRQRLRQTLVQRFQSMVDKSIHCSFLHVGSTPTPTDKSLVLSAPSAIGVNLPAHLVIVKSTENYVGASGYQEYKETQILQMIGRAGRPQYDTEAIAVILTKQQNQEYKETQILQMIGRAGRPQYDTEAIAVILTKQQNQVRLAMQATGTLFYSPYLPLQINL